VGAPDLSTVVERLDETELRAVLTQGRPALGMPPPAPALSATEQRDVIAYLGWLNENRAGLVADARRRDRRSVDWSRLPWWEYR
jgi:hypothetical protein